MNYLTNGKKTLTSYAVQWLPLIMTNKLLTFLTALFLLSCASASKDKKDVEDKSISTGSSSSSRMDTATKGYLTRMV
jgi:hypothetical protein